MTVRPEPRIAQLIRLRDRLDAEIASERARQARIHALVQRLPASIDQHPDLILAAVARHFGLTVGDLVGEGRRPVVSQARAVVAWIARDAGFTLVETGDLLRHSAAIVCDWTRRVSNDADLLSTAQTLRTILHASVRAAS